MFTTEKVKTMENEKNLVTVGIPFFNSEKFLAQAINSVINQTYSNWELFLLDDGSTDTSVSIAKSFEKLDQRITVISDGENLGLPSRLNELSDLSNGKFYCRMDADDIMFPDRLEKQLSHLVSNPEIDLLGTGLVAIDNQNQIIGLRKGEFKENISLKDLLKGTWAVHPTIMGKASWFKENRYDINLKRAQDYDMWIRTVKKSKFVKLNTPYLYYREASTSTIKKYFIAMVNLIKIYWKNKSILGFLRSIKMTFVSIVKLIVYLVFWLFGVTSKLIERRSTVLKSSELKHHQKTIQSVSSVLS